MSWSRHSGRARYRCRHGATSSRDAINRIPTLYVREDQLLNQAAAQLPDVRPDDVPAQMKARRITIVCTPVSAVIETATMTKAKQGPTGPTQPTIPGLEAPIKRRTRGNPHQSHPQT
ncbi:hypothetical protein Abr02nite_79040 [Paractinoplanes brasiliensis]|nr:hypothetical protein Abr02nite_79040 [Actinoplanes brasiliensis]